MAFLEAARKWSFLCFESTLDWRRGGRLLLIGILHNLKVNCQLGIINRRSTCEILEQEQNLSQNLSSEARIIQLKLQKIERRQELWEVNDLAVGFHLHIERIVVNFFFTSLLFFIFVDFKFEVGESSIVFTAFSNSANFDGS